jgi:hypothetical protein
MAHLGGWASHLITAHKAALELQESFTNEDLQMACLLAPRGLVIIKPGDPISAAKDLMPTIDMEVVPLGVLSPGSSRGVKHVAAGIRRLTDWRHFLNLTHSGHGIVSDLHTDTPRASNVSAEAARVTIRRLIRAPALGHRQCGPDMQNMGNWPPIVALGKEGIGRWKNGKGENETWSKSGIRCHILNILVQHGWPC